MKIITSVGEFLDFLKNNTQLNDRYFYRGESQDFGTTRLTASLYRRGPKCRYIFPDQKYGYGALNYKNTFKYNTWKTYLDAAMSFYRNVSSLTEDEKQNFMAFCQHHGLSTPLLDISTSPLVALYFASLGNQLKSGRLYIFKKDNFIPFNNKILSYKYLLNCYRNGKQIYPLLSMQNKNELNIILSSIKKFKINANDRQLRYFYCLINSIIKEMQCPVFEPYNNTYCLKVIDCLRYIDNYAQLYKSIANMTTGILSKKSSFLSKQYIYFLKRFGIEPCDTHRYKMTIYIDKNNNVVQLNDLINYPMLLLFLIDLGNSITNSINLYVPKKLEFYTHCTLNWGRVKAQKSYFIIQTPYIIDGRNFAHSFVNNDLPNNSVTIDSLSIIHKPQSYITLVIKNKQQILKRLNILGINEMTLFMDKDNIANFIKNKFYI